MAASGRHQWREVGIVNEYVADCGEWVFDVNHDGFPDIVTASWMRNGVYWWENPGKSGGAWKVHFITNSYDTEGGALADINGDGKPDLIFSHYDHSRNSLDRLRRPGAQSPPRRRARPGRPRRRRRRYRWRRQGRHSSTSGWFKQIDADKDQWEWHGEWHLGDTGFPIVGYDVLNNGKMDLIYGQGHSYGLYWLEQTEDTQGNRQWVKHTIDESFSSPMPSPWPTSTATASPS